MLEKVPKILQLEEEARGDLHKGASNFFWYGRMNMQISIWKNCLAFSVPHYHKKEWIIIGCQHMHCKQFMEESSSSN